MPELPEVECLRRALSAALTHRTLRRVRVRPARLRRPLRAGGLRVLRGRELTGIQRRGKHLLFRWRGNLTLIVHLGMTGVLLLRRPDEPPGTHEHVRLDFGGLDLGYVDPRRFGWLEVVADEALVRHPALATLGPEPLAPSFRAAHLEALLQGRRRCIKHCLMDQRLLAGVGNLYADEALHRARIAPLRPAGSLTPPEVRRLYRALRSVLRASIRAGGTSFRDYRHPDGQLGGFRRRLRVYGRAGAACPRCGWWIERCVAAGRGTWWCPGCQH